MWIISILYSYYRLIHLFRFFVKHPLEIAESLEMLILPRLCYLEKMISVGDSITNSYCASHKLERMVKKCIECKKQPAFNIEGEKIALYCAYTHSHLKWDTHL